jgi:hypothetical protein
MDFDYYSVIIKHSVVIKLEVPAKSEDPPQTSNEAVFRK